MFWRRMRAAEGPEVEIPVTPMLDMAFQLLIFFIFTYHPSELEGQVEMALPDKGPASGSVVPASNDEVPQGDLTEAPVRIRVRTQHGDESGSIVYPIEIGDDTARSIAELEQKLKASTVLGDKRVVRLESDRQLKYAFLFDVIDACKRAEFTVAFAAPPDR